MKNLDAGILVGSIAISHFSAMVGADITGQSRVTFVDDDMNIVCRMSEGRRLGALVLPLLEEFLHY